MAKLSVNGHTFDVELIVFDKDGVLIEFDEMWVERVESAVAAVWIVAVQGPEGLEELSTTVTGSLEIAANSAGLLENLRPWLDAIFS